MPNKSTLCRVRANLISRRINIVVMKFATWANNNIIIMIIIIVIIVVERLKTWAKNERHGAPSRGRRERELALATFVDARQDTRES